MDYERGGTQKDVYDSIEVENTLCPLCGSTQYKEIHRERVALGIVRCLKCGLIYVNPRLKNPEKIYWGEAHKYFEEARLIFEGKMSHHRDPNYTADLKLIRRYKPTGNFLDVGTNMGFFLRLARRYGWNLYGVEPSPSLSDIARRFFGLNVKTAFIENANFEDNFFDVVAMTDVFEHISSPNNLLREVHRIIKSDGILFIKVPNAFFNLLKFNLAKMSKRLKDYDIFNSYEHVIHYSQDTLKKMLERSGFKVIRASIGKPVQIPIWHMLVGHYYHYPSPWILDPEKQSVRTMLYWLSLVEFRLNRNNIGYLAPNIVMIAKKALN